MRQQRVIGHGRWERQLPGLVGCRDDVDGGASMSGRDVNVSETEFTISLPTMTFTPGEHTFKITNKGTITHALEIDGPGVSDRKSEALSPGASTSMTVTLQKGTYEVYCPVDGHKARGMQTKITVQ